MKGGKGKGHDRGREEGDFANAAWGKEKGTVKGKIDRKEVRQTDKDKR